MQNRPWTRRAFLGGLCAGALATANGLYAQNTKKPNIVLIMADDLGYGDLGYCGHPEIKTPHLDKLAKEGLRLSDFHANGPVCSPTRAALLTGRYQQRTGIEGVVTAKSHRHTGLPLEETTMAELFKEAGYSTALFGKWHMGYDAAFGPPKQGFDAFRGYVSGNVDYHSHVDQAGHEDWWEGGAKAPEEGYSTDLITQHAVQFIEKNQENPFFLYLPHEAPHYPYQGREDKAERIAGKAKPTKGRTNCPETYKEMIEVMDEGIGKVMEALRRHGLAENTLVFFCSDNGASKAGSNAPLSGHKGSCWEGGHRVPAIAHWPGRIAPATSDATTMTMDLFPTFAALSGVPLPVDLKLDGVDLSQLFFSGETLPERMVYWKFGKQGAVRQGPWKLLIDFDPKSKEKITKTRLFNLNTDLGEKNDLAEAEAERVASLRKAFEAWYKEVTHGVTMRS